MPKEGPRRRKAGVGAGVRGGGAPRGAARAGRRARAPRGRGRGARGRLLLGPGKEVVQRRRGVHVREGVGVPESVQHPEVRGVQHVVLQEAVREDRVPVGPQARRR